MVLYLIYRNPKSAIKEEFKDAELGGVIRNSATEVHPIGSKSPSTSDEEALEEEEQNNNGHDNKAAGNENIQV